MAVLRIPRFGFALSYEQRSAFLQIPDTTLLTSQPPARFVPAVDDMIACVALAVVSMDGG
jgi:hypothetical protein